MEIKELIRNARTENGFTQEKAAEELCVSRQTISNWGNGKSLPDILSILKMSDLYHISLDELLKGDKKMVEKIKKDVSYEKKQKYYLHCAFSVMIVLVIIEVCSFIEKMVLGNMSLEFYSKELYAGSIVFLILCCLINAFLYKVAEKKKSHINEKIPLAIMIVALLYIIFDLVLTVIYLYKEKGIIYFVSVCIVAIVVAVVAVVVNNIYNKQSEDKND